MKATITIIGVTLFALVGCNTTENIYHREGDSIVNSKYQRSPGLVTPAHVTVFHQRCPLPKTGSTPEFDKCITMGKEVDGMHQIHYEQAWEPGSLNGMGGAVLQAGAIAYAGNQIGRGLGKSGTNVSSTTSNNSMGGASNNTNINPNSNVNNSVFNDNLPGHSVTK